MTSSSRVYLDFAATTPLRDEVFEAMRPWLAEAFGNPSSLYTEGKRARQALESARTQVARGLGALPEEVIFTNGATESNNWVLKSLAFCRRRLEGRTHLVTSQIEHSSVLNVMTWLEAQGFEVTRLPVNSEGVVQPEALNAALRPDTALVSIMHGNNEVGALQDIETLGTLAHDVGALFHTDAVQTVGKLPLTFSALPVDFLTGTAHKFEGPKGVGFLLAKAETQSMLEPLLHGGGQERGLRCGTENLAAIVGLAKALDLALEEREPVVTLMGRLQEDLIQRIQGLAPCSVLNGPANIKRRVPGNVNFSFPPLEGEALVLRLDMKGFAVSSGSACHSATLTGSHVVHALGKDDDVAKSSLRVSIGRDTTPNEIDAFCVALESVLSRVGYLEPGCAQSHEGVY